ncbi:hypothetical protein ScPMuIL_006180 [Solemya velum]
MVRITEDLIRKRAEHNNCEISTLEELSLHQQDIERIENLDKWCRDLKILYLQSNLIPKIENVGRLKKVEYINLALNNIERIENLEGCESLKKLDMTVNFVGELTSIENLKGLYHFRELYLTGNPCTEFEGYKPYVLATLQQLKSLDGREIEKSERILATQDYGVLRARIIQQQEEYKKKREREKKETESQEEKKNEKKPGFDGRWYTDINASDTQKPKDGETGGGDEKTLTIEEEAEKEKEYWAQKAAWTPETRIEMHKHMEEQKNKDKKSDKEEKKKPRAMFTADGRPYNINEPKLDFSLTDNEDINALVLDIACYRHVDTALVDVDVQTRYVRMVIKGKVFQLALDEEVQPDSSTAKRSQTTGHLLVTMPKAKQVVMPKKPEPPVTKCNKTNKNADTKRQKLPNIERLEVDSSLKSSVDFTNIVNKSEKIVPPLGSKMISKDIPEKPNSEDFVDDPDVPPLE